MTVVLVLLGLAFVLSVPFAILLAVLAMRRLRGLSERVLALETRITNRGQAAEGSPVPAPQAVRTATRPVPSPTPGEGTHLPDHPATPVPPGGAPIRIPRDLEALVGGQWLTWVGVLAIFFGTAFFLAYDLGEHALSGVGQILTGLLVGTCFLLIGTLLTRRAQRFLGQGLIGGGVALLYLAAYAAHGFHDLVPALVVYPFLLGVALIGASVALTQNSLMVASLTLAGALLTPPMLGVETGSTRALFPYLIAVNVGTVVVAVRRRWQILPLGGFLGTLILVLNWWTETYTPDLRVSAWLGVGGLWLLYGLVPFFTAPRPGLWGVARAVVITANGLAFELFLYRVLAPEYVMFRGLATALLSLLYVAGARVASTLRGHTPGVQMLHYTGVALAVLAVPIQFDLAWVTLGWTLLGAVLFRGGLQFASPSHRAAALAVYILAAFRVLVFDTLDAPIPSEGFRPFLNGRFLVGAALVATLAWTAWQLVRHRARLTRWEKRLVTPLVLGAASIFLWRISTEALSVFETRELNLGAPQDLALLLTLSLIWAVYAGGLILGGFLTGYRPIRLLGVVVLGILVLKVFFLDMQALERGYRIASFVGVGLLLLAISVLYQREEKT